MGNARKECHGQQGALHSPATARKRGYSTVKPHRQVVKAVLHELRTPVFSRPSTDGLPSFLFPIIHMRSATFDNKEDLKTDSITSTIPGEVIFGGMLSTNWSRGGRRS